MPLAMSIASFLTIWWTVLFAVLPWGIQSYHDAGIEITDGGDPGAPVNPNLKKKFIVTTIITIVLFTPLWLAIYFHLIHLPAMPG